MPARPAGYGKAPARWRRRGLGETEGSGVGGGVLGIKGFAGHRGPGGTWTGQDLRAHCGPVWPRLVEGLGRHCGPVWPRLVEGLGRHRGPVRPRLVGNPGSTVVPFVPGWSGTPGGTVAPGTGMAPSSAFGSLHCFSSTWGMNQVARKASAAIGTATRNTVWIDSA